MILSPVSIITAGHWIYPCSNLMLLLHFTALNEQEAHKNNRLWIQLNTAQRSTEKDGLPPAP